jgi:hypothetical protein
VYFNPKYFFEQDEIPFGQAGSFWQLLTVMQNYILTLKVWVGERCQVDSTITFVFHLVPLDK